MLSVLSNETVRGKQKPEKNALLNIVSIKFEFSLHYSLGLSHYINSCNIDHEKKKTNATTFDNKHGGKRGDNLKYFVAECKLVREHNFSRDVSHYCQNQIRT